MNILKSGYEEGNNYYLIPNIEALVIVIDNQNIGTVANR
jgi:hypothetical protein